MSAGKGDKYRTVNKEKFDQNYEQIFKKPYSTNQYLWDGITVYGIKFYDKWLTMRVDGEEILLLYKDVTYVDSLVALMNYGEDDIDFTINLYWRPEESECPNNNI